jgi:prolyl 4-hydroxylase
MSVRVSLVWAAAGLLVCWSVVVGVRAELYTCLADMEELLETEALLMQTLDGYIQAQEEKLRMLRRLVNVHCYSDWHTFQTLNCDRPLCSSVKGSAAMYGYDRVQVDVQ